MDPEIKGLLEETHALAKDNHRMLRSIRRGQLVSFMSSVIIWIIVLALPLYLYREYLEPLLTRFSTMSGVSTTTSPGFFGLPTSAGIEKLINSFKAEK